MLRQPPWTADQHDEVDSNDDNLSSFENAFDSYEYEDENEDKSHGCLLPKSRLDVGNQTLAFLFNDNGQFGQGKFSMTVLVHQAPRMTGIARVRSDDNIDDMLNQMMDDREILSWNMKEPNLLISVMSGGKKFHIKSKKLQEVFGEGLVKAANTAGAWIITNGTSQGSGKCVGEAIRDSLVSDSSEHPLVVLGVATWDMFTNLGALPNKKGILPESINPFHTHFIFVDNSRAEESAPPEQTTKRAQELRFALEDKISTCTWKTRRGLCDKIKADNIPIVHILLNGGPNIFDNVKEWIEKNNACDHSNSIVAVQGSGGATDILAYAYSKTKDELTPADAGALWLDVLNLIKKDGSITNETEARRCLESIQYCLQEKQRKNIKVFSLKGNSANNSFDAFILKATFKVNKDPIKRLGLALAWNCVDVTSDATSNDIRHVLHNRNKELEMHNLMHTAIIKERHEFVKLLLDEGFSLERFLTKERLLRLYQEGKNNLRDLAAVVKKINEFTNQLLDYKLWGDLNLDNAKNEVVGDPDNAKWLLVRKMTDLGNTTVLELAVHAGHQEFVAHPACQELLNILWMGRLARNSEKLMVLAACFPFLAPWILNYGTKNRLSLKNTENIHYGGDDDDDDDYGETAGEHTLMIVNENGMQLGNVLNSCTDASKEKYFRDGSDNHKQQKKNAILRHLARVEDFLLCPKVKFYYYSISYLAFLVLFGIIVLTDFHPTIGIKEYVLIAWIISILIEEGRQFFNHKHEGSIGKKLFSFFVEDLWNLADLVSIVTYVTGLTLRCIPLWICQTCFYRARIILAFSFIAFFLRILQLFTVSKKLGPQLIMMGRMIVHLFYFLLVLMVIVSAYGIASQSILYPNQPLGIDLVGEVLSKAWWGVFGQIDVEEVSGGKCTTTSGMRNYTAIECAERGYDTTDTDLCWGKPDTCPAETSFMPILLAVYMLFTNILMLNMLIAIFSKTIEDVQDQTTELWKLQRYHLVKEFKHRPVLPPPLNILSYIYKLGNCVGHGCREIKNANISFSKTLVPRYEYTLRMWEFMKADETLRKREAGKCQTMETLLNDTRE